MDRLAHVAGRGILAEAYRWAELEQLVYSPSRWERRLVGSTIATIPFVDRSAGRTPAVARRGLGILGELIGDAEPDVQKALSWALRNLSVVDRAGHRGVPARARRPSPGPPPTATARGSSATPCEKLPAETAAELRDAVAGIRKRPGAPSTSRASATAADFEHLGAAVPPAERTDR